MSSTGFIFTICILIGMVLLAAGLIVALIFGVRALIRHNDSRKKNAKQQEEELERMKLHDL